MNHVVFKGILMVMTNVRKGFLNHLLKKHVLKRVDTLITRDLIIAILFRREMISLTTDM